MEHLGSLIFPVINFVLYLAFLSYAYKRWVLPMLNARSVEISQALNRAAEELAATEREVFAMKQKVKELTTNRENIIRGFQEEGERIARTIIETARDEAKRVERESEKQVGYLLLQAEKEISSELVRKAVELAKQKLAGELKPERDREFRGRLIEEAVIESSKEGRQ